MMKIKNSIVQKIYAITVIILLLGVLALQNEKVFGIELFAHKTEVKQPATFTNADIIKIFPDATQSQIRNDSIIVFRKMDEIGWAYNTSPGSDSIIGFTSSVPLLIGFNKQN